MTEHPNSFLVHQCLQAVSSGDHETLRALWVEDIVWHFKGGHVKEASPWRGEIKGPNAIFEYLAQLGDAGSDDSSIDVEDVMIGEERAALVPCKGLPRWPNDRIKRYLAGTNLRKSNPRSHHDSNRRRSGRVVPRNLRRR